VVVALQVADPPAAQDGAEDFLDWLQRASAAAAVPLTSPALATAASPSPAPSPSWEQSQGQSRASPVWPGLLASTRAAEGAAWVCGDALPAYSAGLRGALQGLALGAAAESPVQPWASPRSALGEAQASEPGSAEPWASGGSRGPGSRRAAAGEAVGEAAADPGASASRLLRTWQAAPPSTQPAPRSWLMGAPPRAGAWGARGGLGGRCAPLRQPGGPLPSAPRCVTR
jgi:hypothetical protein